MKIPEEVRVQSLTTTLHIHGWQHLDAVILAALATESPVLLIGLHGTAKTLLVERLSRLLGLEFRHYNASLLNYDDLVGIPIPDESDDHLRFITTPGAIWDAEFVFFDEISRCRPDLQNKLFPIIHERRVVGMNLAPLRYRWAAMNPPSPDNPDFDKPASDYYLGSEPLDPALTDRFPFVIPVPNWRDLSRDAQRDLLGMSAASTKNGAVDAEHFDLAGLVDACRDKIPEIEDEVRAWLVDYMIAIMDLLEKASLPQSPRRARMLVQSVVAIHAARLVLAPEPEGVELADSAELGILYGIPQNATEVPPTPASLVAIHRQAWELTHLLDDDAWREILEEPNPIKRVLIAEKLDIPDDELSRLITQALNVDSSEARKVGLATAMFLHFRKVHALNSAAWEPLARLAGRVLLPRQRSMTLNNNTPDQTNWEKIEPWVVKKRESGGDRADLLANYVLGGFPELWRNYDWQEAVAQFEKDLDMFEIEEV